MNDIVTVIIPCHNEEKYLNEFLISLQNQNYDFVEIIFVNDASTDNSLKIFNDWATNNANKNWNIKTVNLNECKGASNAVCCALKLVTGKYIMPVDCDDILLPYAIEKKVKFLDENSDCAIVQNRAYSFDGKAKRIIPTFSKLKNTFETIIDTANTCLAGTYMVRTKSLFEIYKDKNIPVSNVGQNLQLTLPVINRYKLGFIEEVLFGYRIHSDSHSHEVRMMQNCIKNIDNYCSLILQLLEYCICDKDYYKQKIKQYKDKSIKGLFKQIQNRINVK